MNKRASYLIEYTLFIVIVIAALIGVQVYVKRALCGRWRSGADVFGQGKQYEPNVTQITTIQR